MTARRDKVELPRGTVTLLFTDIEGSTRLLHEFHDAYADVLAEHRRLLREAFARHGGVEVDTQGDAFFYAFERAADAVAAAADAQAALAEGPVRVRIGVHTGEPLVAAEGYVGVDVHRAARIMSAGHGGQVLVSETTRRLVDARFELRDLGAQRLKDLTEAQHLFQLGDGSFPPLKTLNQTNLPVAAGPLLGREVELADLRALVVDGARVVTVTGPGGSGKTRLALQAAAETVERFADGVWWVPLAAVSDPSLVLPSVAQALGVKDELDTYLTERQLLLVLDNFEHLLAAAPSIAELLSRSARTKVLATSRGALRIEGEREYALDPMSDADAVGLFVERARDVGRLLEPDADVQEICRRLDRLPLALELAAARTKLMAPAALLARLEHRLPILGGGRRDAPKRQRTLRATIEWSYELLEDDAKELLARLSVFAGSFSFEAAADVSSGDFDTFAALVDLSLLKPIGDSRFLMLETIREFASDLLLPERAGALRERHARFYDELARDAEPHLEAGSPELLDALTQEHANIRAALAELLDRDPEEALLLAARLRDYWRYRGFWGEGRDWLERALRRTSARSAGRVQALLALGFLAFLQGDWDVAENEFSKGRALAEELEDAVGIARALNFLASLAHYKDENATAERLGDDAIEIARDQGDWFTVASALGTLGAVARQAGELERAETLLEESAAISRAHGYATELSFRTVDLGGLARIRGDNARAESILREGLEASRRLGDEANAAFALALLGDLASRRGDAATARALGDEALAMLRELGDTHGVAFATRIVALAELSAGNTTRVERLLDESLALAQGLGDRLLIAIAIEAFALTSIFAGKFAHATRLIGAADRIRGEIDISRRPFELGDLAAPFALAREQLGERAFETARAEGAMLTTEAAIELATQSSEVAS